MGCTLATIKPEEPVFYEDGEKKNQFLSYDYMKTKNGELEEVKKGLLKFLNEAN